MKKTSSIEYNFLKIAFPVMFGALAFIKFPHLGLGYLFDITFFIVFFWGAFQYFTKKKHFQFYPPLSLPLLLFSLTALIGIFFVSHYDKWIVECLGLLVGFYFVHHFGGLSKSTLTIYHALWGLIVGGFFASTFAILQWLIYYHYLPDYSFLQFLISGNPKLPLLSSFFGEVNRYAAYNIYLFPISLVFLKKLNLKKPDLKSLFLLVNFFLLIIAILISNQRSPIIVMFIMILLYSFKNLSKHRWIILLIVFITFFSITFVFKNTIISGKLRYVMDFHSSHYAANNTHGRPYLWSISFKNYLSHHWLIGRGEGSGSHNLYIDVLERFGALGLGILLFLFYKILKLLSSLYQVKDQLTKFNSEAIFYSMSAMMIGAIFYDPLQEPPNITLFYLLLSLSISSALLVSESKNRKSRQK